VCICLTVTDSEIENVIDGGATTRDAVTRACGAGGDCGACHSVIETMIEDRLEAEAFRGCPRPTDSGEQLLPERGLVRARVA
jgi:bacterioferritin-associated ferredoxin